MIPKEVNNIALSRTSKQYILKNNIKTILPETMNVYGIMKIIFP
jgi:hypothetical protein